ncbi:hypothetical protein HBA54_04795 [Pelagibius litoralis]|uniref:Uncharacterized protein n=1 Tax=Pelagibius litoralis TaxID=374515 RepID=A0A967CAU1_9PROT|nr:hypothetical protein [Pelagibius litoralis]NIA67903.1 hypothetical protein [Pelagibius litoralis]
MSAEIIDFLPFLTTERRRPRGVGELPVFLPDLQALGLEPYGGRFVAWEPAQAAAIVRAAEVLRVAFTRPHEFVSSFIARASRLLSSADVDCTIQAVTFGGDRQRWSRLTPEQRAMVWLCCNDTERAIIWGTAGIGGEIFFTRYGMITDIWEPDSDEEGPDHAA